MVIGEWRDVGMFDACSVLLCFIIFVTVKKWRHVTLYAVNHSTTN